MGYVMPPRVPTNRQSQYGGRQHTVTVLALQEEEEEEEKEEEEEGEEEGVLRAPYVHNF